MTAAIQEQHAKHMYYDRMTRQYIIEGNPPAIPAMPTSTCRNCGAPKHGAVCEYCKT